MKRLSTFSRGLTNIVPILSNRKYINACCKHDRRKTRFTLKMCHYTNFILPQLQKTAPQPKTQPQCSFVRYHFPWKFIPRLVHHHYSFFFFIQFFSYSTSIPKKFSISSVKLTYMPLTVPSHVYPSLSLFIYQSLSILHKPKRNLCILFGLEKIHRFSMSTCEPKKNDDADEPMTLTTSISCLFEHIDKCLLTAAEVTINFYTSLSPSVCTNPKTAWWRQRRKVRTEVDKESLTEDKYEAWWKSWLSSNTRWI